MSLNWDPMKIDYDNDNFNAYDEGPGTSVSSFNLKNGFELNEIKLYIKNIPKLISEKALGNLFKRAGDVKSAYICKKVTDDKYFGFVIFNKSDEASEAISRFNNFTFGDGTKLFVGISKTKEEMAASHAKYTNYDNSEMDQDVSEVSKIIVPLKIDQSKLITRKELDTQKYVPPSMPTCSKQPEANHFCINCTRIADLRCDTCEYQWYCSYECQKIAWCFHFEHCRKSLGMDSFDTDLCNFQPESDYSYEYISKEQVDFKVAYKVTVTRLKSKSSFYGIKHSRSAELKLLSENLNDAYEGSKYDSKLTLIKEKLYVCKISDELVDYSRCSPGAALCLSVLPKGWRRVRYDGPTPSDEGTQTHSVFDIDSGEIFDVVEDALRAFNVDILPPKAQAVHWILFKNTCSNSLSLGGQYTAIRKAHTKFVVLSDVDNPET